MPSLEGNLPHTIILFLQNFLQARYAQKAKSNIYPMLKDTVFFSTEYLTVRKKWSSKNWSKTGSQPV